MREAVDERIEVKVDGDRLVLNGLELPHIYVMRRGETYSLVSGYGPARKIIDNLTQEELDKFVPFIANVFATTTGWTGFGASATPLWTGQHIQREVGAGRT